MKKYPIDKPIEIVENVLHLDKFIYSNRDNIIQHIERFVDKSIKLNSYNELKEEESCENMVPESVQFLSDVIPFMSGIVNVGATQENFLEARDEVSKIFKEENGKNLCGLNGTNPCGGIIYILSFYTLIYIIEKIMNDDNYKLYMKKHASWLYNMPSFSLDKDQQNLLGNE